MENLGAKDNVLASVWDNKVVSRIDAFLREGEKGI